MPDAVNAVGRWIAQALDAYSAAAVAVLILGLYVVNRIRAKQSIEPMALIGIAFDVFTLITGIATAAVLLLTRPPAFDLIPKDWLPLIGLVVLIAVVSQVFHNLRARFASPPPPSEPPKMG